jgi:Putative zincin peptidase
MTGNERIKAPVWLREGINTLIPILIGIVVAIWLMKQFSQLTVTSIAPIGVLILLLFCHIHIHEYSHFITAKFYGYKARVSIRLKNCDIDDDIKPKHFILIAIMPLLVDILIFIPLLVLFPATSLLSLAFFLFCFQRAASDLGLFFTALRYSFEKNRYLRSVAPGEFELLVSNRPKEKV